MPYEYEVYKQQRVSLVSFHRAVTGPPQLDHPDIDDRGYFGLGFGLSRGPIVGVSEGSTVFVELRRDRIDSQALLFVTSSDPAAMTVSGQEGKELLVQSAHMQLQIKGLKGSGGVDPKVTELEVRYGSKQGVIIGVLSVWIFTVFELAITPHLVTIKDGEGSSLTPSVNISAVLEMAKPVWQPCGVSLAIGDLKYDEFTFDKAGQVSVYFAATEAHRETRALLNSENFIPRTMNLYFVNKLYDYSNIGGHHTSGITYYHSLAQKLSVKPGILVEEDRWSAPHIGTTVAHEIGHFLSLEHVDQRQSDNPRNDTWSNRMLMYPIGVLPTISLWVNDVGYGSSIRGCLLTLKDLTDENNRQEHHITDPEWLKPRALLNSDGSFGPY